MKYIARVSAFIAGGALAVLVAITVLSVVARYVFDSPLYWLEEVSGLLMIWIVMVGAVVTERDRQHLTIPMLTDRLPRRLNAAVEVAVTALSVVVLAYVGWLGWRLALGASGKLTDVLQISWFWIDVAVTVGAAGVAVCMALAIGPAVARVFGADDETAQPSPIEGDVP